jgi:hypothetical protein
LQNTLFLDKKSSAQLHFFVDFWKDKEARVIFVRELHCALCIVRELRGALSKSVHCLPPSCSGAITEKLMARGTALIDVFPLSVGGEEWSGVTVLEVAKGMPYRRPAESS